MQKANIVYVSRAQVVRKSPRETVNLSLRRRARNATIPTWIYQHFVKSI